MLGGNKGYECGLYAIFGPFLSYRSLSLAYAHFAYPAHYCWLRQNGAKVSIPFKTYVSSIGRTKSMSGHYHLKTASFLSSGFCPAMYLASEGLFWNIISSLDICFGDQTWWKVIIESWHAVRGRYCVSIIALSSSIHCLSSRKNIHTFRCRSTQSLLCYAQTLL